MSSDEPQFTKEELQAFAEKLRAWSESLSPKEAAIASMLIDKNLAREAEVEGFGYMR